MILCSLGHAFLSLDTKKKKVKGKGSSEVHTSIIEVGRTYLYEERGALWECYSKYKNTSNKNTNSQIEKNWDSCDVAVKSKVKSVFAGREKRE